MGNVHDVVQTEPFESPHGAALPLRPGAALVDESFPSYTSLGTASRAIGRSRLSTPRPFLVIQTGGKWGYGYELEEFLGKNAPVLEDAVFYVSDEYAMYVREWRIANGQLSVEFVAPDNSHTGLVLIETPKHRELGLALLEASLDDTLWGGTETEEPTSIRHRSVMALVHHRPERWQSWYQRGLLEADYAPRAAVTALERALAMVPAAKRSMVEVALSRALEPIDPLRALEIGRAAADRWIADATIGPRSFWNPVTPGLWHLAELERKHGATDRAAVLYTAWLRVSDHETTGPRLYHLACLHARAHPELARSYLRVALDLAPELAQRAATEPELAPIR